MARRREDVDWYVEMSEALERRERRRKWVVLGIAVALPLLVIVGLAGFAVLSKMQREDRVPGWLEWVKRAIPKTKVRTAVTPVKQPETFEPASVKSFDSDDIIYSQLDRNGFVTSISHFFREVGPDNDDPNKPFTVIRSDEYAGKIELYRLRNVGTGEVYEFENVPVTRLAAGNWVIGEEGERLIRDQLQARMRVQIRRIGGG
jgi:hypothetical protein